MLLRRGRLRSLAAVILTGLVLSSCLSPAGSVMPTRKATSVLSTTMPSRPPSPAPTSLPTLTAASPTASPSPAVTIAPAHTSTPEATALPPGVFQDAFAVGFSADGRLLAFNSDIPGIIPVYQAQRMAPFLYNTENGTIEWIQASDPSRNLLPSTASSLSANGRYLLYGGMSNSPVPAKDHVNRIYLRDLQTRQDERIDFLPLEKQFLVDSIQAVVSPDGRYLALEMARGRFYIDLLERATGRLIPVSGLPGDYRPWGGDSYEAVFSPDGRYLAFVSSASYLVDGDTPCSDENPACGDVFLYEIATGKLERIPAHMQFTQGNPYPYLTVSNDARFLAWTEVDSSASFLRPVVRMFDRANGKMGTVCAGPEGACTGHSPSLSSDGRWLAFATFPSFSEGKISSEPYGQVYLLDHQTGELTLLSASSSGAPGNGNSGIIHLQQEGFSSDVRISGDGRFVAFSSQATNLLPEGYQKRQCFAPLLGGVYSCYDLFVYDRVKKALRWISQSDQ